MGRLNKEGKRTHGHGEQYGDCWGEGSIRGLKGNRKNRIKIRLTKEK